MVDQKVFVLVEMMAVQTVYQKVVKLVSLEVGQWGGYWAVHLVEEMVVTKAVLKVEKTDKLMDGRMVDSKVVMKAVQRV